MHVRLLYGGRNLHLRQLVPLLLFDLYRSHLRAALSLVHSVPQCGAMWCTEALVLLGVGP